MSDTPATPKPKHSGEKSITIWTEEELVARLDQRLAALASAHAPGRFSRQGYILAILRRELDAQAVTP